MSTPALARAADELGNGWTPEQAQAVARDVVSAALDDPDGAIVEVLRTEFAYQMRTSATRARLLSQKVADEDIANAAAAALAKVRAAILGSEPPQRCAWCDAAASGQAEHGDGRTYPSCGAVGHGLGGA